MIAAEPVAERKRNAMVSLAQSLVMARLQVALAGLNGRSRLGKLLEAAEAEVYAQADRKALEMIAVRLYDDATSQGEFVARQIQKREERAENTRKPAVSLHGRGLGIGVEKEKGKAPGDQGALPFVVSDNSGGKASL